MTTLTNKERGKDANPMYMTKKIIDDAEIWSGGSEWRRTRAGYGLRLFLAVGGALLAFGVLTTILVHYFGVNGVLY